MKNNYSFLAPMGAISFYGGPEASGAIKDLADSGTSVSYENPISASKN